ncbi:hypothetical protein [Streptomyces sp. NPDC058045]|uniref:hypothetical protein n=1 Tax=Streptomyces sp. NPDC058045 TaxID=3346311 RepID=UPI0036F0381A
MTTASPPTPTVQRDATAAFEAFVAEHQLTVEERDPSFLAESLRDQFVAWYFLADGKHILVVPTGQDPAVRLAAARALIREPQA